MLTKTAKSAPPLTETERLQRYFQALTPLNAVQVNRVHSYASRDWFSTLSKTRLSDEYFNPTWFSAKCLVVTIRDGDWGTWQSAQARKIDFSWLDFYFSALRTTTVKELRLELEMVAEKAEVLLDIANHVGSKQGKCWKRVHDLVHSSWTRPSSISSRWSNTTPIKYEVITVRWSRTTRRSNVIEHISGAMGQNGVLRERRASVEQPGRVGKRRGGRRSRPVSYNNRGGHELVQSDLGSRRAVLASSWQEEWGQNGSLSTFLE